MRVLDLFSGAGGSFLGAHQAGLQHVACVEWDGAACATLSAATGGSLLPAHPAVGQAMPGLVRCMDVRALEPPAAEVWWSSPPCQAWSSAGKRLGMQDQRNGWPWLLALLDRAEQAPVWLFAENVAGMTHHSSGHPDPAACSGCYLQTVLLPALRARFAVVQMQVLDCSSWGLPQRRKRLIIAAGPSSYCWPTASAVRISYGQALGLTGHWLLHHGRNTAAHPHQERWVPSTEPAPTIGTKGNQLLQQGSYCRRLTVAECARLMGFPDAWPWQGTQAQQYRQVGNSCPPVLVRTLLQQV